VSINRANLTDLLKEVRMPLVENQAIEYLIANLNQDERSTSSHWQKYHKDFQVNSNIEISGAVGFGGSAKEYKGVRKFLHSHFQKKFREMGKTFRDFSRIDSLARQMTKVQGRAYDLDVLRQTLTLSFLVSKLEMFKEKPTVAVIGDGFASMSLLLLLSGFAKKVILVNLSKTLLVDILYFQKYSKSQKFSSFALLTESVENISDLTQDLICIQASNHEFLKSFPIDLFINIASMQEMNPDTIENYFKDIREVAKQKTSYFYCCNRVEKKFPDGTVVKFFDYPWSSHDQILVDELCPWHQQYYSLRPPFYRPYDGPIQHRLVKISGEK